MKIVFLLAVALSMFAPAIGQNELKPELFDEFPATLCSDDLKARIDLFLAKIHERTGSTGSIVITPDRSMPGRAIKYRKVIELYIRFRGFDPGRIRFSERPYGNSQIQLWLIPKGARPMEAVDEPARTSETTLFDASEILIDYFGELGFGGNVANEPCDFGLRFDQFASVLVSNKELVAHLLYSSGGKINRRKADAAVDVALKQITKHPGVAADRITTKYIGKRKRAELQLWLVPKGGAQPVFREGAVP